MILITGANGHLGSHIVKNMLQNGYSIRGFCRPNSNQEGLKGISGNFEIVEGDILDPDSVSIALKGCRGIIHTASLFSSNPFHSSEILRTAIEGTLSVARAAIEQKVERMVYTSSAVAVGASSSAQNPLDENSWNEHLVSAYAEAKTKAEKNILSFAKANNLLLVIVCPSTVIGAGDFRLTPSNALIKKIMKYRFFYSDGGINLISVEDAAEGHRLAYEKGRTLQRYILSGENLTFKELIQIFDVYCKRPLFRIKLPVALLQFVGIVFDSLSYIVKRPMPISLAGINAHVGRFCFYTNKKSESELGFYLAKPIEDTIRETIDWISMHHFNKR